MVIKYKIGDLVCLSNPWNMGNFMDEARGIILNVSPVETIGVNDYFKICHGPKKNKKQDFLYLILDFNDKSIDWWHSDYFRKLK